MVTYVLLAISLAAGLGLVRLLAAQRKSLRYLAEAVDDRAPRIDHLPAALQRYVLDTRALRLSLEAPLWLARAGGLGDELHEANRELGEWLNHTAALPASVRAQLEDLDATPDRVRRAFDAEGWAFSATKRSIDGSEPLPIAERLARIVAELARIERALTTAHDPYRR